MTHKCDVNWCERESTWTWPRTQAELTAMFRGKLGKCAQPSRSVCDVHRPHWRTTEYVPYGEARAVEVAPIPKPRARRVSAPVADVELGLLREQLAAAQAQVAKLEQLAAALRENNQLLRAKRRAA